MIGLRRAASLGDRLLRDDEQGEQPGRDQQNARRRLRGDRIGAGDIFARRAADAEGGREKGLREEMRRDQPIEARERDLELPAPAREQEIQPQQALARA